MFQHRGKQYEYTEWTTYNGDKASCYTCSEFSYAPFNFKLFSANTKVSMEAKIDYFLDNYKEINRLYTLNNNASVVFYETLTYKGD